MTEWDQNCAILKSNIDIELSINSRHMALAIRITPMSELIIEQQYPAESIVVYIIFLEWYINFYSLLLLLFFYTVIVDPFSMSKMSKMSSNQ